LARAERSEVRMPEYQNSCFISYKHPPVPRGSAHLWWDFVDAFQAKLEYFITLEQRTYRDDKLRSTPGVKYPAALSRNLCQSVCMIAILVPEYMRSNWCRAEWRAMEKLERDRNADSNEDGIIIPIMFRGKEDKIAKFCGSRTFMDFSNIVNPKEQLDSTENRERVDSIARRVAELARYSPTDCGTFAINVGPEVVDPDFDDPNPLK
jgi:hypothetical protein